MSENIIDKNKLDKIIKKSIEVLNLSRSEVFDISENARKVCNSLEYELAELKIQVCEIIDKQDILEARLKEGKRKLALVSKYQNKYDQIDIKKAYVDADDIRIELAVKREKEQYLIKRRNELEIRIREAYTTVEKATNLLSNLDAAMGYLSGELQDMLLKIDDIQQRQMVGLRIIKAQEDERQRLSGEIHDGPAQSLSSVVLKAELCEKLLDVDLEKARSELVRLKEIIRESLKDVRKIIYNLRPMSLDDLGLVSTLERYIDNFRNETGILISLSTKGIYDDIRRSVSLAVFRIIQEALSNIRKHSKAQNAAVNIDFTNSIKVYVYDDGCGFDTSSMENPSNINSSGFGLFNMRERVLILNGSFKVTSELGRGTRVNIEIPFIKEGDTINE